MSENGWNFDKSGGLEVDENGANPDGEKRPMSDYYGEWQVEDYQPGEVKDGKIPTNLFGNVYYYEPWMLPKGCTVVYYENAKSVGNRIGIHVAPAMVGWTTGRVSRPTLDGYVVATANKKVLSDACIQDAIVKKKKREELEKKKKEDAEKAAVKKEEKVKIKGG
jgi:hypothetical protein